MARNTTQAQLKALYERQQDDESVNLSEAVLVCELPTESDMAEVNMASVRAKAQAAGIGYDTDTDAMLWARWSNYVFTKDATKVNERLLFVTRDELTNSTPSSHSLNMNDTDNTQKETKNMTSYQELQALLKTFRANGHTLQVKLNAKASVLQAEVDRLRAVEQAQLALALETLDTVAKWEQVEAEEVDQDQVACQLDTHDSELSAEIYYAEMATDEEVASLRAKHADIFEQVEVEVQPKHETKCLLLDHVEAPASLKLKNPVYLVKKLVHRNNTAHYVLANANGSMHYEVDRLEKLVADGTFKVVARHAEVEPVADALAEQWFNELAQT